MALNKPEGSSAFSAKWAARGILVVAAIFIVVGLSLLLLFGLSSPGLPAAIWGLLLLVVYGFFEPETVRGLLGQGHVQAGTRALVQVLLVLGAVLLLNVVVRDKLADRQLDLSKNQVNSLAPQTETIVRSVDRPVKATVWSANSPSENQAAFDLLQRYRALNGKLTVFNYAAVDHPALAAQQKVTQAGSVVFETDGRPNQLTTDLTEQGFDTALLRLSTGKAPRAYFLTGHGEPDITTASQLGNSVTVLAAALQKQGITATKLNLASGGGGTGTTIAPGTGTLGTPAPADTSGATPAPTDAAASPAPAPSVAASPGATPAVAATAQVPADADEVVIIDPQSNLSDAELSALNTYVDKGGHLLVAANYNNPSNVGTLIKRFGLSFGGGIILDAQLQLRGNQAGILEFQSYGSGVVTRGINTLPAIVLGSTSVEGKAAAGYTLNNIVTTAGDACERVDLTNKAGTCQGGDKPGPFNVMVTAEQTGAKAGSRPVRVVALGAPTLASDALQQATSVPPANQPLMVNAINWLAGQDKIINVPAKASTTSTIFLTDAQKQLVTLGYPILLPLLMLGLGVNAYLRRR